MSYLLRQSIYKSLAIVFFFFLLNTANAQILNRLDSIDYKRFLPDYTKVQYAGGTGFLSAGAGYEFWDQYLDISLAYGYVPKYFTPEPLHSFCLQLSSKLLRIKEFRHTELISLNMAVFAHYTIGDDYWIRPPSKYPDDYYWWRPGRSMGMNLSLEVKTSLLGKSKHIKGTSLYFQAGTRGLYLVSKFGNSSVPLKDIIELGLGLKFYR